MEKNRKTLKIVSKDFYKQTRADGTIYYYPSVTFRTKIFFGLINWNFTRYVHKVTFKEIYFLTDYEDWKYPFKDLSKAKRILDEVVEKRMNEFLSEKVISYSKI
jgi:hypothetical protein